MSTPDPNRPSSASRSGREETRWPRGDALDDLLGLDPTPTPAPTLKESVVRVMRSATEESAVPAGLDALLELDVVEIPAGLSGRVLEGLQVHRSAGSGLGGDGQARRPRFVLLRGGAGRRMATLGGGLAAAGLLLVAVFSVGAEGPAVGGGSEAAADATGIERFAEGAVSPLGTAPESDGAPSDELLAALPMLEHLDFLTEELDPLEADALFLLEADDALLLELLEIGG